jgi:hypothetical protein
MSSLYLLVLVNTPSSKIENRQIYGSSDNKKPVLEFRTGFSTSVYRLLSFFWFSGDTVKVLEVFPRPVVSDGWLSMPVA